MYIRIKESTVIIAFLAGQNIKGVDESSLKNIAVFAQRIKLKTAQYIVTTKSIWRGLFDAATREELKQAFRERLRKDDGSVCIEIETESCEDIIV